MWEGHFNAHRQFETNPENLPRQRKKNAPGTKLALMVNNH